MPDQTGFVVWIEMVKVEAARVGLSTGAGLRGLEPLKPIFDSSLPRRHGGDLFLGVSMIPSALLRIHGLSCYSHKFSCRSGDRTHAFSRYERDDFPLVHPASFQ